MPSSVAASTKSTSCNCPAPTLAQAGPNMVQCFYTPASCTASVNSPNNRSPAVTVCMSVSPRCPRLSTLLSSRCDLINCACTVCPYRLVSHDLPTYAIFYPHPPSHPPSFSLTQVSSDIPSRAIFHPHPLSHRSSLAVVLLLSIPPFPPLSPLSSLPSPPPSP